MLARIITMQHGVAEIEKLFRNILKEWVIEPGIPFANDYVVGGRIRFCQHVLALEQLQVGCDERLSLGGRDDPQRLHAGPPLLYIGPLDGLDQIIWRKRRFRRPWGYALRHFAFLALCGES